MQQDSHLNLVTGTAERVPNFCSDGPSHHHFTLFKSCLHRYYSSIHALISDRLLKRYLIFSSFKKRQRFDLITLPFGAQQRRQVFHCYTLSSILQSKAKSNQSQSRLIRESKKEISTNSRYHYKSLQLEILTSRHFVFR